MLFNTYALSLSNQTAAMKSSPSFDNLPLIASSPSTCNETDDAENSQLSDAVTECEAYFIPPLSLEDSFALPNISTVREIIWNFLTYIEDIYYFIRIHFEGIQCRCHQHRCLFGDDRISSVSFRRRCVSIADFQVPKLQRGWWSSPPASTHTTAARLGLLLLD